MWFELLSTLLHPQDVFGGERNAVADALNLNAGVALHAANMAASPAEGVAAAQEAQRSGAGHLAGTFRRCECPVPMFIPKCVECCPPPTWRPIPRRASPRHRRHGAQVGLRC